MFQSNPYSSTSNSFRKLPKTTTKNVYFFVFISISICILHLSKYLAPLFVDFEQVFDDILVSLKKFLSRGIPSTNFKSYYFLNERSSQIFSFCCVEYILEILWYLNHNDFFWNAMALNKNHGSIVVLTGTTKVTS